MPDELILREQAREAIRSAKPPTEKPEGTFSRPGIGVSCAVCGDQVQRGQMEFELEFNRHGLRSGLDRYYLHPRCFAAWEFERLAPVQKWDRHDAIMMRLPAPHFEDDAPRDYVGPVAG